MKFVRNLFSGEFWGEAASGIKNARIRSFALTMSRRMLARRGVELDYAGKIGKHLVLAHAWGITVNSRAVLGDDCVLFKGCTIGSVRSGRRAGCPTLGNRVVVGCNAFVCGGIKIGDDVLIAANAFVDFDVPSNSLVIGNPAVIHHKENPCKDYILGDAK